MDSQLDITAGGTRAVTIHIQVPDDAQRTVVRTPLEDSIIHERRPEADVERKKWPSACLSTISSILPIEV